MKKKKQKQKQKKQTNKKTTKKKNRVAEETLEIEVFPKNPWHQKQINFDLFFSVGKGNLIWKKCK